MFKIIGDGSFGKAMTMQITTAADGNPDIISNENYEWIIPCIPSYGLSELELEPSKKYIFVSKGMVKGEVPMLVTEWAEKNGLEYAYLAGPHLASELEKNLPSASNLATKNLDYFYQLEQYFPSPVYTDKTHLTALAGVIKNIIAFACGMYAALQLGENFNSCIITTGMREFTDVAKHLNLEFDYPDLLSPGILADLILTGNSRKSRNFSAGFNHVKGLASDVLIESKHSSIELIKRIGYSQKWPIISLVASMIDGNLYSSGDLMETWKESVKNFNTVEV